MAGSAAQPPGLPGDNQEHPRSGSYSRLPGSRQGWCEDTLGLVGPRVQCTQVSTELSPHLAAAQIEQLRQDVLQKHACAHIHALHAYARRLNCLARPIFGLHQLDTAPSAESHTFDQLHMLGQAPLPDIVQQTARSVKRQRTRPSNASLPNARVCSMCDRC